MKPVYILLLLVVLAGCKSNEVANSGDVNQHTIYQSYAVRYNEETNETQASAAFRFGGSNGTTLVLTAPSSVTFNGQPMEARNSIIGGAWYESYFRQVLPNGLDCKFEFKDTEGKNYINSVRFNAVLMGGLPETLEKGMPLMFTFKTAGLNPGETINVYLADSVKSETFVVNTLSTDGKLLIPASVLNKLNGKVDMRITRFYKANLSAATEEGGTIVFEYMLKPRTFVII
ncbi:MAG TPA: hypothetical protein VEC12_14675 [Bacteroidia bacterium]|nr:hypothetical protein [Bacteroidia bacterium]